MSYSITVSGHKVHETEDAAKAFEEAVRDKAKAFVSSLEGVNVAQMQGQHTGTSDLTPAPPEPAASAEGQ